jgi:uncharacterized repeat protein (TIGR03803 family)
VEDSLFLLFLLHGGVNCLPITPGGTLTTLYTFGGYTDGAIPSGGLIQATDGNLYGTSNAGGTYYWGTVFKITLGGTLTTLHNFCPQVGSADGDSVS